MKKLAILLIMGLICSQAVVHSAVIEKITEQRGYISTNAEKSKDVFPNIAEITFTKENTAKTIEEASSANKKIIANINQALQTFKVDPTKTEIKTGSYTARPNYTYSKNNKRTITGYTVINSITIKTKSTEQLGKMIDAGIKAGADKVGALSFAYENDGTICNDLISEATKRAKTIAETTAKSSNQIIKGIKSINTRCSTQMENNSVLRNYENMSAKFATDSESIQEPETEITPGKIKVKASVNAEFYVK